MMRMLVKKMVCHIDSDEKDITKYCLISLGAGVVFGVVENILALLYSLL